MHFEKWKILYEREGFSIDNVRDDLKVKIFVVMDNDLGEDIPKVSRTCCERTAVGLLM